jgi:cytidylate kinase
MGDTAVGPVVTVSATYGTGGSLIAPRLAQELDLPFIDRLLLPESSPETTTETRSQEGLSEGEQEATPGGRFFSYFARAASVGAMMAPDPLVDDDETIRNRSEAPLRGVEAGAPAVVLGRAAAVVLAGRPRAFHVRLDGDPERRLAWASGLEGLDREAVRARLNETDKARTVFVKRLYRADPNNPALYHMHLDPTVLGLDRTVQVLVIAARAFFEANP